MYRKPYLWFTLIEIIISITILSIIMISVMVIFTTSSTLALKVDINRSVQENVKNAVEDMAENIRKNKINICGVWVVDDCYNIPSTWGGYVFSDTLYVGENTYYLGKQISTGAWVKVTDPNDCNSGANICTLVKDGQYPLTNKNIVFKKVMFTVSNEVMPKVTMNFTITPAPRRWVASNSIDKDVFYFQTTVTQSLINVK